MGSVNKIIKKSPGFIKKIYYNTFPFRSRYGKLYGETLDFLMQSKDWDEVKLKEYQFEQLKKLLNHCYLNVPYYRNIFLKNNWKPEDFKTIEDFSTFPVLTKKDIIENLDDMIAKNLKDRKGFKISTSGSSGNKLTFYVDDDTLKREAAFNMRAYLEQGAQLYDTPSVWLRRYVPPNSNSSLWYYDYELKRLYMSAYHLNSKTVHQYIEKINSGNYQTICTYPSSAYILACLCEENNLSLNKVKKMHVTSEKMLSQWYDKVVDSLDIVPCGHYGQMEKVSFMHQTEETKDYKQNLEYGLDEFYDNGDGTYGLIATGFINYYMPLFRYKTEDTFVIEGGKVKEINGRSSDILVSADGSRLPGVNFYSWIDKKMPGIKMFQIIQETEKNITFKYVQNIDYTDDLTDDVMKGLKLRLGDMSYNIQRVEEIERDLKTNKIRSIINKMK